MRGHYGFVDIVSCYCKSIKFREFCVWPYHFAVWNVLEHLSWRVGFVWRLWYLNLAVSRLAFYFRMQALYLAGFIFGESKETRVIKFSRKLSILQYHRNILAVHCNNVTNAKMGEIKFQWNNVHGEYHKMSYPRNTRLLQNCLSSIRRPTRTRYL